MAETGVRESPAELSTDELLFEPDVDTARPRGRRQRAAVVAAPVVALVVMSCLAVAADGGFRTSSANHGDAQRTSEPDQQVGPAPALLGPWAKIKSAVQAASPSGLDFADLDRAETSFGGLALDGNVDDGGGRGRLLVVIVPAAQGGIDANPCVAAGFRGNGPCTTEVLADGTALTRQGPSGTGGFLVENVVLVHPDGSAVLVEADNALLPPRLEAAPLTPTDRGQATLQITRSQPIYDLEQLTALARAIDAAAPSLS